MRYLYADSQKNKLVVQVAIQRDLELDQMGCAETLPDVREVIDQITEVNNELLFTGFELTLVQKKTALYRRLPESDFFAMLQLRTSNELMMWPEVKDIFIQALSAKVERAGSSSSSSMHSSKVPHSPNHEERGRMEVNMVASIASPLQRQMSERDLERLDMLDRAEASAFANGENYIPVVQLVEDRRRDKRERSTSEDRKRERGRYEEKGCREYATTGKCGHHARTGYTCRFGPAGHSTGDFNSPRGRSRSPTSSIPSMVPSRITGSGGRPSTPVSPAGHRF